MLRNQQINSKQLIKHFQVVTQQCLIQQQNRILCNKGVNIVRQEKIIGKLFSHRVGASQREWFPAKGATYNAQLAYKNNKHRLTILNKVLMEYLMDLMATGEIPDLISGKGLQTSRLTISPDFATIKVFWFTTSEFKKDDTLADELQHCADLLSQKLSQIKTICAVPSIQFVQDRFLYNINQMEVLLRNMNFGTEEEKNDKDALGAQELNAAKLPKMRHDVLGLDHKSIKLKILNKMCKPKQVWHSHLQNTAICGPVAKVNKKLGNVAENTEKFQRFLAERKHKRKTYERKQFKAFDHNINALHDQNQDDYIEHVMSKQQRQIYQAEDYLLDDIEDTKYK